MSSAKILRAKILGTGSYVPPKIVKNDDLKQYFETSDEWIHQRTGIRERRWVDEGVYNSDIALIAAKNALSQANMEPEDIQCIVFGTLSPDIHFPGTGVFLQEKLGIANKGIPCYDIRQQCSAFVYGMEMCKALIENGTYDNILFIGSEIHSYGIEKAHRGRGVSVLFGDGSGAVVLGSFETQNPQEGMFYTETHADGRGALNGVHMKIFDMYKYPLISYNTQDITENADLWPQMPNPRELFTNAVIKMCEVTNSALKKNDLTLDDVNWILPHQANMRINQMVEQKLGIADKNIFLYNIHKYGNTTAATIPLLLDENIRNGKIKKGDLLLCVAFGSGFTWGVTLIKY